MGDGRREMGDGRLGVGGISPEGKVLREVTACIAGGNASPSDYM